VPGSSSAFLLPAAHMPTYRSDRPICLTPLHQRIAEHSSHGAWHRSYTCNRTKRSRSNGWFAVLRSVRRVIAYHLLWRDNLRGSWIPFTVPTVEEVLWVGHDSTYAPTDVWTYWHGQILPSAWPQSQVAIDVQWGKHGPIVLADKLDAIVRTEDPKPTLLQVFGSK
jgi:hypothetical protein